MAWYDNSPKKIDDDMAKAAIELYGNSRTASEQNPRAHVFGAMMVGPLVDELCDFADVPVYGVRLNRALVVVPTPGGAIDVEYELIIGVGVDGQMNDIPGTYFSDAKVEWK